jgi:hypothetical protein
MGTPNMEKPLSDELGGITDKGYIPDIEHNNRIQKYSEAKLRSSDIISYVSSIAEDPFSSVAYANQASEIIDKSASCGSLLVFNQYTKNNKHTLSNANFCNNALICPVCAIRRGARLLRLSMQKLAVIRCNHPHLQVKILTFTIKNQNNLDSALEHLISNYQKLLDRRRQDKRRGVSNCEFSKILGGLASFETTNNGNGWHPHNHIAILVDPFNPIDVTKLQSEWYQTTGDSFVVDITDCKPDEDGTYTKAFMEITKYALKFSEMTNEHIFQAYSSLKGKRLFRAFGLFHGLTVPLDLNDGDEELDGPYIKKLYSYLHPTYEIIHKEPGVLNYESDPFLYAQEIRAAKRQHVIADFKKSISNRRRNTRTNIKQSLEPYLRYSTK